MKLRNKKTGEIVEDVWWDEEVDELCVSGEKLYFYNSLAELNDEWEDYEEPKTYYYVSDFGAILEGDVGKFVEDEIVRKEIGNYFETKEEAEKAVEKLKAGKRLKDKGFRFNSCKIEMSEIVVPEITITAFIDTEEPETLNLVKLLFGGEE